MTEKTLRVLIADDIASNRTIVAAFLAASRDSDFSGLLESFQWFVFVVHQIRRVDSHCLAGNRCSNGAECFR